VSGAGYAKAQVPEDLRPFASGVLNWTKVHDPLNRTKGTRTFLVIFRVPSWIVLTRFTIPMFVANMADSFMSHILSLSVLRIIPR
jgi:hypothetical protein